MVQCVVEFRAEGQDGVFAESSHAESLAEGEIRIELAGAWHDALARVAVGRGPIGSDGRRSADGGGVDPVGEAAAGVARSDEGSMRRAGTQGDGGGGGVGVDAAS